MSCFLKGPTVWSSGGDPICWKLIDGKVIAVHLIVAVEAGAHGRGSVVFLSGKDTPVSLSIKPSEVFDSIRLMLNKGEEL
jgi:hypothetical protein